VTSQREIWDNRYQERVNAGLDAQPPTELAISAAALLATPSDVLEIGCGSGADAAHFARLGHRVVATDFSDALIDSNSERFADVDGLTFVVHDTSEPLPVPDTSHNLVYARLSLHYFDDSDTRRIFDEIARVLRPKGPLVFMCKSTDDRLYGQGEVVGPDMFRSHHLRHFFSEAYTRDVLAARFDIETLVMRSGELYGEPSAWVEVVAKKR
jgi:ubiquinone/menaquinone biosynthesis C-methylase UbiE